MWRLIINAETQRPQRNAEKNKEKQNYFSPLRFSAVSASLC